MIYHAAFPWTITFVQKHKIEKWKQLNKSGFSSATNGSNHTMHWSEDKENKLMK